MGQDLCGNCFAPKLSADEPQGKVLDKCGLCRTISYCSIACQKKDWRRHKLTCSTRAQMRNLGETFTMALPMGSARQAALEKFINTFTRPIVELLAIPHFPALFTLVDTPPLIFHVHFDFHPQKKSLAQLSLRFARQTTRTELQAFYLETAGPDSARFAGVEWDEYMADNNKQTVTMGRGGRQDALLAIRFTATGPGPNMSYNKMSYVRDKWSRSGIDPINSDLDWETAFKSLLRMLEAKTPVGYWTNAVLFADNPAWLRRAEAAFSSAKAMAREVMEGVSDELRKKGTKVHPAALYYSMDEHGGEFEEMGL